MRFGRLVTLHVDEDATSKKKETCWLCQCDCGNTKSFRSRNLAYGTTQSCGCLHREQLIARNYKHGQTNTKLHTHWMAMKQRCLNPNTEYYYLYGGKGIKVYDEWLTNFNAFAQQAISNGYDDSLSLDRIDSNGNYSPENCRWITMKGQANNISRNHHIVYKGESLTLSQASDKYNIPYNTLKQRINLLHWTADKAIETPVRNIKHDFYYNGCIYTGEEISVMFGFSKPYAGYLLKQGKTENEVIDYLKTHSKENKQYGI